MHERLLRFGSFVLPFCLVLSRKQSSGHAIGTTALAPATDIRAPKSAFALISSAVRPGADSQDGGADSPKVTHKQTVIGSSGSAPEIVLPNVDVPAYAQQWLGRKIDLNHAKPSLKRWNT